MIYKRYGRCPICGKPTSEYLGDARSDGLCDFHADMKDRDELLVLNDGENIIYTDEEEIEGYEPYTSFPFDSFHHCILCGKATRQGYAFCDSCFSENEKDFLLKFLNETSLVEYIKKERAKRIES